MIRLNRPELIATRLSGGVRQRGIVLPLVVVGLIAIIAMAGLAIDSNHAFISKTRLQNMSDAAALAAAKVYDETSDTILSTVAANATFGLNTDGSGNFEIDGEYDSGNITVTVQYSETLNPFVPAATGAYIRVIATGFNMATSFSSVIGIGNININASAIAGPSPTIDYACNIAPLVACAADVNPAADYFGFVEDDLMVLKPSPGAHDDVGPGNYKLLRLNCPGGDCVRDNMAGMYEACAARDEDVETEPGVTAGPTSQGFNTRFGQYAGPVSPSEFPPDVVTRSAEPPLDTQRVESPPGSGTYVDQICLGACDDPAAPTNQVVTATDIPTYDYDTYVARTGTPGLHDFPTSGSPAGVPWRRVLAMPVADCTGDETGQSTLEVLGFACYFMLQPIGGGTDKNIFGQFVNGCLAGGAPGPTPGGGPGPYIIQLYKDPDSVDS
ncbi:MAG: pilus assembly protein TadG-related protein [Gammaproteobacteria bacterium]|nr:pilus assembly protein TadG-related protein [Gammaproteobacteria bacterium]